MRFRHLKYSFFAVFQLTANLNAQQEVALNPVQFGQFYNNLTLYNPAMNCTESDYQAGMGNQRLLGNFNKISTYFLQAGMRIGSQKALNNAPFSALGAMLYNDREGKYLNRTRAYLNYVWHGHVSKNLSMAGGFYAGGVNYSVQGTELSGNGSDIAPDGMIGIQFYNRHFYSGISYNQIFSGQLQPLAEVSSLVPYFNVMAGYYFSISSNFEMQTDALLSLPGGLDNYKVNANLLCTWKKRVAVGLGLINNSFLNHSIEFHDPTEELKGMTLTLSYGYPVKSMGVPARFLELGINFNWDRMLYR